MSGAGFLLRHDVAGQDDVEPVRPLRPDGLLEDRPHRRLRRRRGDGQLPAGVLGLGDDPPDARTRRQPAGGDHLGVDLRSCACATPPARRPALGVGRAARWPRTNSGVSSVAMRSLPPAIWSFSAYASSDHSTGSPNSAERLVEGDPVPVALGVGEHAVAVEDERLHHALPSLPNIRMCSGSSP